MRARFLGREKLKRRFAALPEKVREQIGVEFAKGAQDLVAMQRRLAPKKTGKLRESITWRWGFEGRVKYSQGGGSRAPGAMKTGLLNIVVSAGNAQVRYAHLVEFGASAHVAGGIFEGVRHPGAPAQPFFFVSYRAKRRALKARAKRALRKGIIASRGA